MDASRVLVALQEQLKWRDRRERLEARLRVVQSRKRFLQRELDAVRRRVEHLDEAVSALQAERVPREMSFGALEQIR